MSEHLERRLALPTARDLERARQVVAGNLAPTTLRELTLGGRRLWLKLETEQPTGSFKVRGALAALAADPERAPVVACSAGNHGLGVALAAAVLGVEACVVVPETASAAKLDKLRAFDVELVLAGTSYDDAEARALELAQTRGIRFVSPYNDTDVISGQATLATEVLAQHGELAHLVVAVGGGGLAAGCALGLEGSGAMLHGVQVAQNAAFTALFAGEGIGVLEPTVADGIAGGIEPDAITLEILRGAAFDLTEVPEEAVRQAMRFAFGELGLTIEGSAAVALAGGLARLGELTGDVGIVLSGANVADGVLAEVLEEA